MLHINGKNNADGSFDWKDAIADAAIMAGISFFGTLAGIGATGITTNPITGFLAAAIAAGSEFCAILAIKRGLREKQ